MAKAKRSGNTVEKGARTKAKSQTRADQSQIKAPAARAAPGSASADDGRARARPDRSAVNVIRPSRPRSRSSASDRSLDGAHQTEASARSAAEKGQTAVAARSAAPSESGAPDESWALPQSVRERFVQDRRRFYFPDGTEAFRDRGRRLTTGSENTEVVRSLIEIAQVRGWGEIVVEGTERFRREAWRQARLADLEVRGYRPTDAERAMLVRALGRKSDGRQLELDVTAHDGGGLQGAGEARTAPAQVEEASRPASSGARSALLVGTLLDHGRENYRFDPKEDPSYFVRIKTAEGPRTIWGKDLERAMTHSLTQPQIGEEVGLRRVGAEKVTVRRRERDADGQVIGERALGAERHRWAVEKREFFEERATAAAIVRDPAVNRRATAGAHPELVGTFLQLRAAELAAQRLRDPQDRERFVALVRGALADAVERGEPLQPVRLRTRPARTVGRAPAARNPEPVRA